MTLLNDIYCSVRLDWTVEYDCYLLLDPYLGSIQIGGCVLQFFYRDFDTSDSGSGGLP